MREIKVKFIIERAGVKYLSQAYSLGPMGFPSYDEVLELMDGGCTCSLNESNNFCEGDCCEWGDAEVIGHVEFTGLKDKNGADAYHEDICLGNWPYADKCIIEWDDKRCGFYFQPINKDGSLGKAAYDKGYKLNANKFEIIGNSQQNPELLK